MLELVGADIFQRGVGLLWRLKERTGVCCPEGAAGAEKGPFGITTINLPLWGSTSPGGKAVYGVLRR